MSLKVQYVWIGVPRKPLEHRSTWGVLARELWTGTGRGSLVSMVTSADFSTAKHKNAILSNLSFLHIPVITLVSTRILPCCTFLSECSSLKLWSQREWRYFVTCRAILLKAEFVFVSSLQLIPPVRCFLYKNAVSKCGVEYATLDTLFSFAPWGLIKRDASIFKL